MCPFPRPLCPTETYWSGGAKCSWGKESEIKLDAISATRHALITIAILIIIFITITTIITMKVLYCIIWNLWAPNSELYELYEYIEISKFRERLLPICESALEFIESEVGSSTESLPAWHYHFSTKVWWWCWLTRIYLLSDLKPWSLSLPYSSFFPPAMHKGWIYDLSIWQSDAKSWSIKLKLGRDFWW